ncbi:MAG TPA: hypothetical protein VMF09_04765 [Solirubrobacteraceae bacterium]|nr:hypothetical protein [Solirubrobacteraceae bacterium]
MGRLPGSKRVAATAATAALAAIVLAAALASAQPAAAHKSLVSVPPCSSGTLSVGEAVGEDPPKELAGPLEASVLADFAIFRRAAQPSDAPPALNPAASDLDVQLSSYYPSYVRRLVELPDGARYFVIPAFERPERVPAAHCLPRSLRSKRSKLLAEQRRRASTLVYCIVRTGGTSIDGGLPECEPFAEVGSATRVFQSALLGEPIVALVPDEVASVRVVYETGAPVLAGVDENGFSFSAPAGLIERIEAQAYATSARGHRKLRHEHLTKAQKHHAEEALLARVLRVILQAEPIRVEWLGAGGAVVRSIARPAPTQRAIDLDAAFPAAIKGRIAAASASDAGGERRAIRSTR